MPLDKTLYRPAAGIALFNQRGEVFLGRRSNTNSPYIWQMPQGGIDAGESPKKAAIRELEEETGIKAEFITPLGRIDQWLYYDFPPGFKGAKRVRGWHGQRQKWFAFRFTGKTKHINLNAHKPAEFIDWRWDSLERASTLVVPFKRPVYAQVKEHFGKFKTLKA